MNFEDVEYKIWISVRNSVDTPVWHSVLDSVNNSFFLRDSVWNSVRNSVWESVNTGLQDLIRREREQG